MPFIKAEQSLKVTWMNQWLNESMKIPEGLVEVCEVTGWEDVSGITISVVVSDVVNDISQFVESNI